MMRKVIKICALSASEFVLSLHQEVKAKESEVIDFERKLVAPPLRRRHSLEVEAR